MPLAIGEALHAWSFMVKGSLVAFGISWLVASRALPLHSAHGTGGTRINHAVEEHLAFRFVHSRNWHEKFGDGRPPERVWKRVLMG